MHSCRILIKSIPFSDVNGSFGVKKRALEIAERSFQAENREKIKELCQGKVVIWAYPNQDDPTLIDLFALCETEDDGLIFKLVLGTP